MTATHRTDTGNGNRQHDRTGNARIRSTFHGRHGPTGRRTRPTGTLHTTPILNILGNPKHLSTGHMILPRTQRMITGHRRRSTGRSESYRTRNTLKKGPTRHHNLHHPHRHSRRRHRRNSGPLVSPSKLHVHPALKVSPQRGPRRTRGRRQRHIRRRNRTLITPAIRLAQCPGINQGSLKRHKRRHGVHGRTRRTRYNRRDRTALTGKVTVHIRYSSSLNTTGTVGRPVESYVAIILEL